jgi:DNA-binding PadR family transcriptional regulator
VQQLTELDFCVLGVIWREGPLSAYAVRKVFRDSTTAGWSSSSGSIYPSIRRLLQAGLATAGAPQDRRNTRVVVVTKEGKARLREWLVDLRPVHGTATPDPIRTRAQFLTVLSARERSAFVAAARKVSDLALRELETHAIVSGNDPTDDLDHLGTVGAIGELEARLIWLDQVLAYIRSSPPGDSCR